MFSTINNSILENFLHDDFGVASIVKCYHNCMTNLLFSGEYLEVNYKFRMGKMLNEIQYGNVFIVNVIFIEQIFGH